jgi:ABC-type transport system substrate-binding protein
LGRSPLTGNGGYTVLALSKKPDSPFKDVRLRQAVSLLIDRDAFIDAFYNVSKLQSLGLTVESAWNSHVPSSWKAIWLDPQTSALGDGAKYFKHDPDEAAKLLKAANAFGIEQELAYHSDRGAFGGATHQQQMEAFAEMLQAGGHFKLKTVTGPYATFFQPNYLRAHGNFDGIAPDPSGSFPDIELQLDNNYQPGAKNDVIGDWGNVPGLQDIMDRLRNELDPNKRNDIVKEFQKFMAVQMPAVPYPGLASVFDLYWPWVGNAGVYLAFGSTVPGAADSPAESDIYLWYDKSKDTRTT